MITALLIFHGLLGVALLGAITHQVLASLKQRTVRTASFVESYINVRQGVFPKAVALLFAGNVIVGAIIYPTYRVNVRIPFEEMSLGWAVGIFEMKEHFAGIGLALLPLYLWLWHPASAAANSRDRAAITVILAFVVWWDFIVGHVLNNLRGLA